MNNYIISFLNQQEKELCSIDFECFFSQKKNKGLSFLVVALGKLSHLGSSLIDCSLYSKATFISLTSW